MNLFIGVVIAAFNAELERSGRDFMLTEVQKKWESTKILALKIQPLLVMVRPKNQGGIFYELI